MGYRYSIDESETPSEAVACALAEVEGCSPLEIEPLGAAIDTDALDGVVGTEHAGERTAVSFECAGYRVVVTPEEVRIADD